MKKILLLFILLTSTLYAQPPIAQPNDLMVCDQNSNGSEAFDLTSTIPAILNGLNPSLYSENFYTSLADAQNEVSPIVNPSAYINSSNPQTIYVRVLENANPTNFAITDFDLIVNIPPAIVQPPNLIKYESPFDGITTFNLTSKQIITLNGINPATVSVAYFTTLANAETEVNTISNPTSFTNVSNPQTVYVRVEDNFSGCFSITQFSLHVVDSNGIINIPDANFKAELLAANSTNQIAKNLSGGSIVIDTNNNGEIEISEAIQVYNLDLRSSSIASLEGIQYFIALGVLNCSNNDLSNVNISSLENLIILAISDNELSQLDVSALINLITLNCDRNNLTLLDLNNLSDLEYLDANTNDLTSINFNNTANLKKINCSFNNLTNLDFSSFPTLTEIRCSYNSLTTLNVDNLSNLKTLMCSYNQLSSLDISDLVDLNALQCGSNLLTSLNLNGPIYLLYFGCNSNLLTTVDFSPLNHVKSISVGNPGLASYGLTTLSNPSSVLGFDFWESNQTDIDLSMFTDLQNVSFYSTSLTSVDISQNSDVDELFFSNNLDLEYVNMKNGNSNISSFYTSPSLEFVCTDDYEVEAVQSQLNNWGLSNVVVNSYCSFNPGGDYNTISGTFQFDFNNNGCDSLDPNANYIGLGVSIDAVSTNSSVYSNGLGVYNLFTSNPGVYGLTPNLENLSYFNVTPSPAEVPVMTIDNSTVIQNFCISANGVHPDLEVVIAPVIPARPGFQAVYKIVYKNKGNHVMSQNYGLNFFYNHNLMSLVSTSVVPSAQVTGGLQWDYANLMPFESRSILVTFLINPPTDATNPVNIDDILTFTSVISPQAGDETVADNTFVFNQTVVGSYDPNDITCLQGNLVVPTLIGEYLHYMIRFENTGTAPAENIVVKTEIDATQYNINSIQMLAASNNATIRRTGNKIEFIFQNIQLDSGGHGNVLLKIQSNNNLVEGDSVTESAAIYFDYNFPVITNDEETVFATLGINNPTIDATVSLYPNPVKDVVNIRSASQIQSIQLYDVQGRLLQTMVVDTNDYLFNLSERTAGVYFVKITTDSGVKIEKMIKE